MIRNHANDWCICIFLARVSKDDFFFKLTYYKIHLFLLRL